MTQTQLPGAIAAATAGPWVEISTPGSTTTDRSLTISGSLTDCGQAASTGRLVEIEDDGVAVGTAVVAGDGTWSSEILLAHLGTNSLTASAADASGRVGTSAPVLFTLDTVLSPPSGGASSASRETMAPDPSRLIRPAHDGTVSGTAGSDTFVFQAHPGHAVIEGFDTAGVGGDRLSFSHRSFATLRDVLHHTTLSGGDAVIHLSPRDSVTLVGVSKAELRATPGAFAFHA